MRRPLPLRLTLTLVFVAAMTVVLGGIGLFLYLQTKANLDAGIDAALRSRARDVVAAADAGAPAGRLARADGRFVLLDPRGRATARNGSVSLTPEEAERARRGPIYIFRGEEARVLAAPAGGGRVIAVAASLRQREHAMEGLATALLIGGPLALFLAALAAWWTATRAFASVDRMRARAAAISIAGERERLPLADAPAEIRRLGETLNGMLDRIADSAEHERRFVADASHQLRTPLSILQTELDLALQEHGDVAALRASIASALEEADRVARLATALLTLARADEHSLISEVADIPVAPLASRIADRFAARARREGRSISVSVAAGDAVRADPIRLEEALANLVENALTHGAGRVAISSERVGRQVRIHVTDEGDGFHPQFAARAFDRFTRGSTGGAGTGLGLAISAAVAAAHAGDSGIELDAAATDVWLSLPAVTRS
jgi:two-component system, OmpR family, sensor kinase